MCNIDQFLLNMSIITESKNISTVENIINNELFNSSIKKYLPKTSDRYGSISNELTMIRKLGFDTKENKIINRIINSQIDKEQSKGIIIKAFETNDDSINVFTIPGISLNMNIKQMSLSKLLFGSYHAKKYKIEGGYTKHNKIWIKSSSKVIPLIIATSGFTKNKILTDDEKFSVVMHEIGHWVSPALNRQNFESIFALLSNIMKWASGISAVRSIIDPKSYSLKMTIKVKLAIVSLITLLVFIFLRNIFSKSSEFAADSFVKQIGRGKSLANAFRKFEGNHIVENKEELKEIETLSDKLSIVTDLFSNDTHPTTHRRVDMLLDDAFVLQESIVSDFSLSALDKMIVPIMHKLDNIISRKFRPMLWAYSSK